MARSSSTINIISAKLVFFFVRSAHECLKIGVDAPAGCKIPERQAADLIIVAPVGEEFVDVFAARLVLAGLGVVQVERRDAPDQKRLHVALVAPARDGIGLERDLQLHGLIVELLGQYEQTLAEVGFLPAQLLAHHLTARLGHLDLPPALAPVEDGQLKADFDHLVVLQLRIGAPEIAVAPRKTDLSVERHLPATRPGPGHLVVGFELAAAQIIDRGAQLQRFLQHVAIFQRQGRHAVGQHRDQFFPFAQGQERTQREHVRFQAALAGRQRGTCVEHVQTQLEQVVLADFPHAPLAFGHLAELFGILQVLAGDADILAGQQQVEVILDDGHRDALRGGQEIGLRLGIANRFDTAVPLHGVHAEQRLAELERQRYGHELPARAAAAELRQEIERCGQREGAARQPDTLVDGKRTAQAHIVVAHISVRTVALLIGGVVLTVAGKRGRKTDFGKQFGAEAAGQHDGFGKSQRAGRELLRRKRDGYD